MIEIIVGGILATIGGMVGIWLQAKSARKIRMEEAIAEKKVQINAEAYSHMKTISSMLIQASLEDTYKTIIDLEDWFFNARIFLPGKFPDKWLSVRNGLSKAKRLEGQPDKSEELTKLEQDLSEIAEEAILEIYKDMKLERIKIDSRLSKDKK